MEVVHTVFFDPEINPDEVFVIYPEKFQFSQKQYNEMANYSVESARRYKNQSVNQRAIDHVKHYIEDPDNIKEIRIIDLGDKISSYEVLSWNMKGNNFEITNINDAHELVTKGNPGNLDKLLRAAFYIYGDQVARVKDHNGNKIYDNEDAVKNYVLKELGFPE